MAESTVGEEQCSASKEVKNDSRILIVGAGLAGLSAANHLVKHGVRDFTILEARNRIGGRVISIPLGTHKIELGAMWIHGVLGNPIYELALTNKLINITLDRKKHNVVAFTDQGQRVPIHIIKEVYEVYYFFLRRCEEFYLCRTSPPSHIRSVGQHLELDIANYLNGLPVEDRQIRKMVFNHLLAREACISGCHSMDDIDLSDFGSYTELPGGNLQIDKGFSSILQCLVANTLPPDCIHKQHSVKKIRWMNLNRLENGNIDTTQVDADQITVNGLEDESSSRLQRNVEIECENGSKFFADQVLITMPLGVLKERAAQIFDPPLPQYKLDSINRLSFGTVNKIFLEYDRPFLLPDLSEILILWNSDDSLNNGVENVTPNNTWYKKIYSFMKVNEVILLTWLSGEEALLVETVSAESIAETCTDILRTFLKDPYIPKPMRVVRTRWHSEVNTRGSYTAIAVGSSQEDIVNLSKPIYRSPGDSKPVLLFAGEATHPTFYSTTHGAFLTGRSAAQILLEPDSPKEINNHDSELGDLSSWIQGIALN